MQNIEITTADVAKALHRLKTSMSWSPDNISAYFLRQVGFTLVHIMTYLFNLYIKVLYQMSGNVPLFTPIYKKSSHDKPINYKPISLQLCVTF